MANNNFFVAVAAIGLLGGVFGCESTRNQIQQTATVHEEPVMAPAIQGGENPAAKIDEPKNQEQVITDSPEDSLRSPDDDHNVSVTDEKANSIATEPSEKGRKNDPFSAPVDSPEQSTRRIADVDDVDPNRPTNLTPPKIDVIDALKKLGALVETDDNLTGDSHLNKVISVDLSLTKATNADIALLAELTNLKQLDLSRTTISDAGLVHLVSLTQLELLWLSRTQITDAGLRQLKGMNQLKSLGLTGTQITDAGLTHLKDMTRLEYLLLGKTKVTGRGLNHLTGLKNLEGISLIGLHISARSLKQFKQALPDCQVVADASEKETIPAVPEAGPSAPPFPEELPEVTPSLEDIRSSSPAMEFRPQHDFPQLDAPNIPLAPTPENINQFIPTSPNEPTVKKTSASIHSNSRATNFRLGVTLAKSGDFEAAMPLFVDAVGEAAAHYNVGVILFENALEASEHQFQLALEIDPGLKEADIWIRELRSGRPFATPAQQTPKPDRLEADAFDSAFDRDSISIQPAFTHPPADRVARQPDITKMDFPSSGWQPGDTELR